MVAYYFRGLHYYFRGLHMRCMIVLISRIQLWIIFWPLTTINVMRRDYTMRLSGPAGPYQSCFLLGNCVVVGGLIVPDDVKQCVGMVGIVFCLILWCGVLCAACVLVLLCFDWHWGKLNLSLQVVTTYLRTYWMWTSMYV